MSIVKRDSGILAGQEPVSTSGKLLLGAGAGSFLTLALAALLPGGFFFWASLLIVAGVFFA